MKFLENFDLLLPVFVFIPLAVSASFSYMLTIRNYGAAVYNPPWKKIISSITNEIFFLFVFGVYIKGHIYHKEWKGLTLTILFFIMCFGIIIISRFFPRINEHIRNKTATKEEKTKVKKQVMNRRKIDSNRMIPMSEYIGVVLSYFSRFTFAMFILIIIILNAILNTYNNINNEAISKVITYWNIIANVVTSISISINSHLIFELLSEQRNIPNDSKINKLKERLND